MNIERSWDCGVKVTLVETLGWSGIASADEDEDEDEGETVNEGGCPALDLCGGPGRWCLLEFLKLPNVTVMAWFGWN
jgi:hypothetical protein